MTNNKIQTLNYFAKKAESYDLVEQQLYWQLSDLLLWETLDSLFLQKLSDNFYFLDAGGGTGRWTKKILNKYSSSQGMIYDLSSAMLKQAELKQQDLSKRLTLQHGDIQNMKNLEDNCFDLTFNFHNVLGFVDSPIRALKEMVRVTKMGGYVLSFVPNLYHNIFFNILQNRLNEAELSQKTLKGRFTEDMPYINLFTPSSLKKLYLKVNLKQVKIYGFPVTIYPGMQETQITGSTSRIVDILANPNQFERILKLEKEIIYNSEVASRGNNIFIGGLK